MKTKSIFLITLFTIIFSGLLKAQPQKGKFINVATGLGLSAPDDESDISGSGFYAQGEYVIGLSKWFGVRPYAGVVFTSQGEIDKQKYQMDYKVTSNAFLFGGKVRVLAPVPYVAPYFEIGIGASIGSFQTYTPQTNISKNGLLMHIPFSLGLALGRKNNFDLGFTYYFHPDARQFSGAAAIGFTFPVE